MQTQKDWQKHQRFENTHFNPIRSYQAELDITVFLAMLSMRRCLRNIEGTHDLCVDSKKSTVQSIFQEVLKVPDVIRLLNEIRLHDKDTFKHSVQVSVLSLLAGGMMHYKKDRLFNLGVGSVLHDIGKTRVSRFILQKPGKLTDDEYESVKQHAEYGYDILRAYENLDPICAEIAKCHHERLNGTGYPKGISASEMAHEVRIVAVADVYDALASKRVYRNQMDPYHVLQYMIGHERERFDEEVLRIFFQMLGVYPVGTWVILSNNDLGVVVKDNQGFPSKPVVKILKYADWMLNDLERSLTEQPLTEQPLAEQQRSFSEYRYGLRKHVRFLNEKDQFLGLEDLSLGIQERGLIDLSCSREVYIKACCSIAKNI